MIRIDLGGKDSEAFDRLSQRLVDTIEDVVNKMSQSQISNSTRSTLDDIAEVAQGFIQAKAQKPTIENQKVLSEISREYAIAEERIAQARKTNAEAESVEIGNAVARLESALSMLQMLKNVEAIPLSEEDSLTLFLADASVSDED